jgi:hypothetical protein
VLSGGRDNYQLGVFSGMKDVRRVEELESEFYLEHCADRVEQEKASEMSETCF